MAGNVLNSQKLVSTPFSFGATVSAFRWQNKSVDFSDVDENSYNLSSSALTQYFSSGGGADTVLATHVYGNPCDVAAIGYTAKNNGCKVIYDAAHCFSVCLNNNSILNYGDASVLSFHATKLFHSVEGGAVVFSNGDDYELAKAMINFGIAPGKSTLGMGINAKLSEYHAASGLVNLDIIDQVIEHRAELFCYYRCLLKDCVGLPEWHEEATLNGAYMPILVPNGNDVVAFVEKLLSLDVQSRRYFYPSLNKVYPNSPESLPMVVSEKLANSAVCLHLHYYMTRCDVRAVCNAVKSVLK